MNKIECKVCQGGGLELRDLPTFPDPMVQRLGGILFWGAVLLFVVSAVVVGLLAGTLAVREESSLPAFLLMAAGWMIGLFLTCLLFAVVGAVLIMRRPRLQCTSCSATVAAH